MSKVKYKKIIYLALIIIWMLIVFMFSNQNGNESHETSQTITKIVVRILTYNQNLTESQEINLIESTNYFIRKLAHFSIYAIGGILIYNYINTFELRQNKKVIISIIVGGLYATFDELHQYFIAERSAQILDVCIDSSGIIIGVIFTYLINKIKKP